MGCCFSSDPRGLAVSVTSDVDAPLEEVWETLKDVPGQPSFRKGVNKIELFLKKKDGNLEPLPEQRFVFEEGAMWRENTIFEGEIFESINSVASVKVVDSEDGEALSRTVQIGTQFVNKKEHKETAHTSTYSVVHLDGKTSRLQVSMAYLPDGIWGQFDLWRRGKMLERFAQCVFQERLDEFAAEAEKRYKGKT